MKWLLMVEQAVSSSHKYLARLFWYCLLRCFPDFLPVSIMELIFTWLMSLGSCVYMGKTFENYVFGILLSIWGNGKSRYVPTCSWKLTTLSLPQSPLQWKSRFEKDLEYGLEFGLHITPQIPHCCLCFSSIIALVSVSQLLVVFMEVVGTVEGWKA